MDFIRNIVRAVTAPLGWIATAVGGVVRFGFRLLGAIGRIVWNTVSWLWHNRSTVLTVASIAISIYGIWRLATAAGRIATAARKWALENFGWLWATPSGGSLYLTPSSELYWLYYGARGRQLPGLTGFLRAGGT